MSVTRRAACAVWILMASFIAPTAPAAEQTEWHVPEASRRFEVSLDLVQQAAVEELRRLGGGIPLSRLAGSFADSRSWRATPDVFLADLPAKASTLTFDPRYKWLVPGIGAGKPDTLEKQLGGEGTWAIKPEYRWFVTSLAAQIRVWIDGQPATSETGAPGWAATQVRYRIPPGAKELKVVTTAASGPVRQMGFITRPPAVAEAWICLGDGMTAADLVPIVVAVDGSGSGKEVGAWSPPAAEAAPWQVVFDASSGAERFHVYAVPKQAKRAGPKWTPAVGVWLQARSLDRYDPKINDPRGFLAAWKRGRPLGTARVEGTLLDWFPFTLDGSVRRHGGMAPPPELSLARWYTHLDLPGDGVYQFRMRGVQGATLLVDDTPVVVNNVASGGKPKEVVDVELKAGRHKVEVQQWCQGAGFMLSAALAVPGQPWRATLGTVYSWEGQGFDFGDTVAPTIVQGVEQLGTNGAASGRPLLTLDWTGDRLGHWPWTAYAEGQAEDLVGLHFRATLSPPQNGAVFRFTFDDGSVAEGQDVKYLFLSPGIRTVRCVAVDADGRTIAETTARVRVEANRWTLPVFDPRMIRRDLGFEESVPSIVAREPLFATMPIADLVNVHAWTGQGRHRDLQRTAGAALAARLDEALASWKADATLFHADLLAEPWSQQYAAAGRAYKSVFDAEPPGSPRRIQAALALARLLATHEGKAAEAASLLEALAKERLPVDWRSGWELARDSLHHPSPMAVPVAETLAAKRLEPLAWGPLTMPLNWHLFAGAAWNMGAAAFDRRLDPASARSALVEIDVKGRERVAIWCEGSSPRVAVLEPRFVLDDGSEQPLKAEDFALYAAAWGRCGQDAITVDKRPRTDGFGAVPRYASGGNVAVPSKARRFRATVVLDDASPAKLACRVRVAATETDRCYWFRKSFDVAKADAGRPLAVTPGSFTIMLSGNRFLKEGAVWFDGNFLGQPADGAWTVPAAAVTAGRHEVMVLLQDRRVPPYATAPGAFTDMRVLVPGPYEGIDMASRVAATLGTCLLAAARTEEGLKILDRLAPPDARWPPDARDRSRVVGQLKRARQLVASGDDGPSYAIDALEELAVRWPRLRLDPEWRTTMLEAHVARGEHRAADPVAHELRATADLADPLRRRILLASVRITAARGDISAARGHAADLERNWPYADETLAAADLFNVKKRRGLQVTP
ncbi:MAG: PA14 domain-containing protein [Planctomycetia bacterium]|nr:PA14 domain-containing protein [Planctomycetia bacterium]